MDKFNQIKNRVVPSLVSAMQATKTKAVSLYNVSRPALATGKTKIQTGILNGRVKLAKLIMPKI